jgi:hypothetical protein
MDFVEHQQTVKAWGRTTRLGRWAIVATAIVVFATGIAASLAAPDAGPPATPRALGDFFLGPRTARAEVVIVVGTAVHDIRIDQGRVLSSSATSLVMLERDGTRQTIPIGPATQIFGRGQLVARAKVNALAIREGDGPAQSLYVGAAAARVLTPKALGQLFLGPRMARAEVVMMVGNVLHDYRIDQGRLVSIGPTSLTLLERDNTQQTIPISPATEAWLGNQLGDVSALEPRTSVMTIRDGDQPAQSVRAAGAGRPAGPGRPQGGQK